MSEKTLLLIDSMNVAYRAFYAIRELSTRDGRPTNALFGFIKTLQQLQQTWKPTHWAAVFDGGLPGERMDALATYKAQREPMPDALERQLGDIDEYLVRAAVTSFYMGGEEADDVMATVALRAARDRVNVLLATTDKDMYQIVDDRISIVPPSSTGSRMGPEEVAAKTGVRPERIVEWLALMGDAADNIPGVPGIGPKTAARLLKEFGALDALWGRLDAVSSEKLRAKLAEHRDEVVRNVGLVTLRSELDCEWDWEDLAVREPDPAELLPFYEDMEFHSLARALRSA